MAVPKLQGKFTIMNFEYIKEQNSFVCLNETKLEFQNTYIKKTANGYTNIISLYSAPILSCKNCSKKSWCTDSEYKSLHVNWALEEHKAMVRKNLSSEKGILRRKQRAHDVETVFADRKWNQGSRRYLLTKPGGFFNHCPKWKLRQGCTV